MTDLAKIKNGRQGEGGGRPMVVLNDDQKQKLAWMAPYLTIEMMADSLEIPRSTFSEILKRDPEVAGIYHKHKSDKVAEVASSLVNKARDGDTRAAMFYLRTQGRWREEAHSASERPQIQINVSSMPQIEQVKGDVIEPEAD